MGKYLVVAEDTYEIDRYLEVLRADLVADFLREFGFLITHIDGGRFDGYLDRQLGAGESHAVFDCADIARAVFAFLDIDGDGRHELCVATIALLDPDPPSDESSSIDR